MFVATATNNTGPTTDGLYCCEMSQRAVEIMPRAPLSSGSRLFSCADPPDDLPAQTACRNGVITALPERVLRAFSSPTNSRLRRGSRRQLAVSIHHSS